MLTTAAHRVALRSVFTSWMTPQRFRTYLQRIDAITITGTGAEKLRALDLLLRFSIGAPAVYGDSDLSEGSATAETLRLLLANLPPGVTLVVPPEVDLDTLTPGMVRRDRPTPPGYDVDDSQPTT